MVWFSDNHSLPKRSKKAVSHPEPGYALAGAGMYGVSLGSYKDGSAGLLVATSHHTIKTRQNIGIPGEYNILDDHPGQDDVR